MEHTYKKIHTENYPTDQQLSVPHQRIVSIAFMGCVAVAFIYSIVAFLLESTILLFAFLGLLIIITAGLHLLKKGQFFISRVLLMIALNAAILILGFLPIPREVIPLLFFNLTMLSFVFFDRKESNSRVAFIAIPIALLLIAVMWGYPQLNTPSSPAPTLSSMEKAISMVLLAANFGLMFYFLKASDRLKVDLRLNNTQLKKSLENINGKLSENSQLLSKHFSAQQKLEEENEEQQQQLVQKEIELRRLTDEAERVRLQLNESKKASAHVFEQVGHLMEEAHLSSEMLQVQEDVLKANLDIQKFTSEQVRIAHIEQQKFAAMVENSSDIIALFDFEGQFLYINNTGKQLIGEGNIKRTESQSIRALFKGSESMEVLRDIETQMESIGRWHGEIAFTNQHTGLPMVMDAAIFTVYDGNSEKPICQATVQRDITDKKKVENDLKKAYNELQHSELKIRKNSDKLKIFNQQLQVSKRELEGALKREEQSKEQLSLTLTELKSTQSQLVQAEKMASLGQLTAGIAHEINNPINFVYAGTETLTYSMQELMKIVEKYSELKPGKPLEPILQEIEKLKEESDFSELKEDIFGLIDDIMIGAVRTSEIVKGLRNFSRLDEHKTKLANIEDGIDSTLVLLKNQLKDRILIHRKKGGIPALYCYPGQLNQVFMNVLTNAAQAIKKEGNIWIETQLKGNELMVKIKDDGVGMSEDVRKKIFEPFFTTKDVGKGTGLGMSISYGIIQKHRGRIEVISKKGQGSEFRICLPTNQDPETPA